MLIPPDPLPFFKSIRGFRGRKENNRLALRCSINILEFDLHSSLGSTHSSCVRLTNYLTSLSRNFLSSTIRHIIPALLFCSVMEGCK